METETKIEKTYTIKTLEDILSVVNSGNIKNFQIDFCDWLEYQVAVEDLNKSDLPLRVRMGKVFNWIDDGKTGANIKIVNK